MSPSPLCRNPRQGKATTVYTIALPTLPINYARAIACGLCLVCTTLAPLASHAFTYDTQVGPVVVQHQSAGTPLVWPEMPIAIRLELGAVDHPLLNGTTSWDDNAATALAAWNAVEPIFLQQSTALNVIHWAQPAAGEVLGMQVAKTIKEYGLREGHMVISRATVLLNPAYCWDAYEGPLRSTLCNGRWEPLLDIQRVILHELGHVAGLEHPDDGGQVVGAIMNHGVSDLDELTPDDEAGLHFLYPAVAPAPSAEPQTVTQAQQASGGGGGGCTLGAGDNPDLLLFLLPLAALGAVLRRTVRG
jgi:Matrixin